MLSRLITVKTLADLQMQILNWGERTVALVPTMGALHGGHLSLVRLAKERCDKVVVSIFVNPTQFGAGEDYDTYPRQEEQDLEKLRKEGVDLAYIPYVFEVYPDEFSTKVSVGGISEIMCGAKRPGHFDGVATIVTKLLLQVNPSAAIFGEKDYQQLMVIRRMVADLNIPVEIIGAPILREKDGLAMSSRNAYLKPGERKLAPQLYRTMQEVAGMIGTKTDVKECLEWGKHRLLELGFTKVDYLELREGETLALLSSVTPQARLFAAAYLGQTRLIDNIPVYGA